MPDYPPPEIAARFPFVDIDFQRRPEAEMLARAESFLADLGSRRSARVFSDEPVPRRLIDVAIQTAATAPSGAHHQPWRFVVVGDPETKRKIRVAAEAEEEKNYSGGRLNPEWREALEPLGTTADKSFLDTVPWIVVVFEERFKIGSAGEKKHNYYVKESVGIACGFFIAALHNMGLATLTHTPSPMAFLTTLLERPDNERPFILFPIGYPEPGSKVPDLARRPMGEIMVDFPPAG